MERIVDLHLHTNASDGVLTTQELMERVKRAGLCAVSITDHDTITAYPEAIKLGQKFHIEVIPGVEISVEYKNLELHILGYLIDYKKQKFLDALQKVHIWTRVQIEEIVHRLIGVGFHISEEMVWAQTKSYANRRNIAMAVVRSVENRARLTKEFGQIPSASQFIEKYLVMGKPTYVTKQRYTPQEAIEIIHEAKGVAVLAHPGFGIYPQYDGYIDDFLLMGLDGIEVYAYYKERERTIQIVEHYQKFAQEKKLLATGGSDFHEDKFLSDQFSHEIGFTNLPFRVDYSVVEAIRTKQTQLLS